MNAMLAKALGQPLPPCFDGNAPSCRVQEQPLPRLKVPSASEKKSRNKGNLRLGSSSGRSILSWSARTAETRRTGSMAGTQAEKTGALLPPQRTVFKFRIAWSKSRPHFVLMRPGCKGKVAMGPPKIKRDLRDWSKYVVRLSSRDTKKPNQ